MPKINQEEYEVLKGLGNTWKWIARNKDGDLGVYDEKVIKVKFYNFWIMAIKKKINSTLFSFIQWKDEEPHNISELIEEYEFENVLSDEERFYELYNVNESEETEVKNIEWLKEEVFNQNLINKDGYIYAGNLTRLLDQLDESEVLSSDWIKDNQLMWTNIHGVEYYVPVNKLYGKIVPKQEEVTHKQVEKYLLDKNIRVIDIDIYEEIQSELEELKDGVTLSKTETVADVVTTFWKSYERLKEVMSMEVEELEE